MDINSIIVSYLENNASDEEKEFLLNWIKESDDNKKLFERIVITWEKTFLMYPDKNLEIPEFDKETLRLSRTKSRLWYIISGVAAAIITLVAISFFLQTPRDNQITIYSQDTKKQITFPDGSVVWLNKNSSITFPDNFEKNRTVSLHGEGFFNVKRKDDKRPFIVKTKLTEIKVIGTQFYVDNSDSLFNEAVLQSGIIQLTANDKSLLLKPNQKVNIDKETNKVTISEVNPENYTNWTNSKLVFKNKNLDDAFLQMEKWFGVTINNDIESLKKFPVSLTINDETLEETMKMLSLISPLTYEISGNIVTIQQKKKSR